uniref:Uncharacterized protein n=1 Tax=Arundo donax TaxID=35708 RepID=A0A0A9F327_ARUDO
MGSLSWPCYILRGRQFEFFTGSCYLASSLCSSTYYQVSYC